jgi:hypothetical protein
MDLSIKIIIIILIILFFLRFFVYKQEHFEDDDTILADTTNLPDSTNLLTSSPDSTNLTTSSPDSTNLTTTSSPTSIISRTSALFLNRTGKYPVIEMTPDITSNFVNIDASSVITINISTSTWVENQHSIILSSNNSLDNNGLIRGDFIISFIRIANFGYFINIKRILYDSNGKIILQKTFEAETSISSYQNVNIKIKLFNFGILKPTENILDSGYTLSNQVSKFCNINISYGYGQPNNPTTIPITHKNMITWYDNISFKYIQYNVQSIKYNRIRINNINITYDLPDPSKLRLYMINNQLDTITNSFNNVIYAPYNTGTNKGIYYDLYLNYASYSIYFTKNENYMSYRGYLYNKGNLIDARNCNHDRNTSLAFYSECGKYMNNRFTFYNFQMMYDSSYGEKYFVQRQYMGSYPNSYNDLIIKSNNKLDITIQVNTIKEQINLVLADLFNNFNTNIKYRYSINPKTTNRDTVLNFALYDYTFNYSNMNNFIHRINDRVNDINNINNLYVFPDVNNEYNIKAMGVLTHLFFDFKIDIINNKTIKYILFFSFEPTPGSKSLYEYLHNILIYRVGIVPINTIDSENNLIVKYTNTSQLLLFNDIRNQQETMLLNQDINNIKMVDKTYLVRNFLGPGFDRKCDISDLIQEYTNIINNIREVSNSTTNLEYTNNSIIYTITVN